MVPELLMETDMADEYITKREFDGFGQTVRGEFQRVGEQLTQVASKLDTLVNGRILEARVIGEISGAIKAINERLERLERDRASDRSDIDELRKNDRKDDKTRLNWWSQMILVFIAAIAGALASRMMK